MRGALNAVLVGSEVRLVVESYESVIFSLVDWSRFRLCPFCDTLFVRNRKQRFCTPKCVQRWHDVRKCTHRPTPSVVVG